MQREVLAVTKRVLGAEHPDTLSHSYNLAAFLKRQGKHDEAVAMLVWHFHHHLVLFFAREGMSLTARGIQRVGMLGF